MGKDMNKETVTGTTGKDALTRRSLIKGMAIAAAGVAAVGLAGCTDSTAGGKGTAATTLIPSTWDAEADLVVVGYGGAGACAAIEGSNQGLSVIVLEKESEATGGNTGTSSGSIHTSIDVDDVEEHIEKITHGCFGTTPDPKVIRGIAEGMAKTRQWLLDNGIKIVQGSEARPTKQRPAGRTWQIDKGDGTGGEGWRLFEALHNKVSTLEAVDIRLGTPAKKLIQNPETKEIVGVVAETGGSKINIKAKKGVVLACGGYENDPIKQGWYNYPGLRLWPWGTPHNTGDGIDMAAAVGADLWHLHGLEWAAVNYRIPTEQVGCAIGTNATTNIVPYNYIFVNKKGLRFMDDSKGMGHDTAHKPVTDFDTSDQEYFNVPFWMVFDSNLYDAAPLYTGTGRSNIINTYAGVKKLLDWGTNDDALAKGWIVKADTIEELAGKMTGIDPSGNPQTVDAAGLASTLAAYNGYVAQGTDSDFERPADKMGAIAAPFYAIELGLTTINTQGGPAHNEFNQSLDTEGMPIPRLYNVGELGSVNGYTYVAGNISEALTTGRIAAAHAAGLAAWDA